MDKFSKIIWKIKCVFRGQILSMYGDVFLLLFSLTTFLFLPLSFPLPCDEIHTCFEVARQDLEADYENLGQSKRVLMVYTNAIFQLIFLMLWQTTETSLYSVSCHTINLPQDSRFLVS